MKLFLSWQAFLVVVGVGMAAVASGQTPDRPPPRIIRAVRASTPPTIDGHLTEEAWATAPVADGFTQRDPDEGRPATERTEVRILFDDTAVYVGARMFDGEPSQITRRLSPRDNDADADRLTIYLDPMRDKLTGAIFRVFGSISSLPVLSSMTFAPRLRASFRYERRRSYWRSLMIVV